MSSKLRILVPVKRVVDHAIRPRVNKQFTNVETKNLKFSINPFDDIAVEESVKLKETHPDAVESIHAVSVGPLKAQDVLRTALAKGCDSSTLVEHDSTELEPLVISKVLKKIVEDKNANLVVLGKQAIDDDSNNTGQMLAGLLNWPQATNACKVELLEDGASVRVTKEIDGGEEIVVAKLPMIITTDLRLNTPRYATLPNLMKAKKKPLEKLKLKKDFEGINLDPQLKLLKVEEPPVKSAGIKVSSVDELVSKLKEAKLV
ncbi:Cir1 [Kluyveromyces lactis]|uniref:Probable electron transfer flavoprotein subunit beta n=1 Tax=Kluyveromyces lactis (strain ATCC 8585 / CBS 2359 / DSM 70799 / NBRC 1267 / NRRL Y-1140 / WM37) TaxID=284590 RepID=Q6CN01_KLULA|nr:uncharacterized protein KLLA0_E16391g [Kluyveromyces lactis]QEU61531.1 Cir1 [Kluyveromyces lactis]CAG99775.1 KLLA0E16391p [Kluyveromyces lactis]|eukprot:XP_454688.1 uncharacterized protein KLLA0_E16391g [Kluyveromyces lactis]